MSPKSFCTAVDWLKRRAFFLNQVVRCALNDDCAHADKGNMYKNMHEDLFMTSQTGVFRMAMIRTVYVARASVETPPSLCYQGLIIFTLAIRLIESPCITSACWD